MGRPRSNELARSLGLASADRSCSGPLPSCGRVRLSTGSGASDRLTA